ncbi:MAG: hypothetical protein AAF357_02235 [Verrucomicrobiota bacterium]
MSSTGESGDSKEHSDREDESSSGPSMTVGCLITGVVTGLSLLFGIAVLGLRTVPSIGLSVFIGVVAGALITLLYSRIATSKEQQIAKETKEQQVAFGQMEEDRKRREREERDAEIREKTAAYQGFGFTHRIIDQALAKAHAAFAKQRDLGSFTDAVATALLGPETPERGAIERLLPAVSDETASHQELFSFAFSDRVVGRLSGTTAEEFRKAMIQSLQAELQTIGRRPGELGSSNDDFFQFEVLSLPGLAREVVLTARKPRMKLEKMVHYQVVAVEEDWKEVDVEARRFSEWEMLPSGSWREIPSPYLYGGDDGVITMGPRLEMNEAGERFRSAVVDFWSDELEKGRTLSLEDLAGDEGLQRRLGIRVQRQTEPFIRSAVSQQDRKGFVEVVGWFLDGEWEPIDKDTFDEDDLLTMLNASAPNLLVQPYASSWFLESNEQNKLLTRFLRSDSLGQRKGAVFSQGGNFELMRGPVTYGSKIHTYFIRLAENASVTKFLKPPQGAPDDYQVASSYQDFPEPRTGFSPLEDKGYRSVPVADCYFRTGSDSFQLVLKVNLGSPAVGESSMGVSYSSAQLAAALRNFARREGVDSLEILEEESAQGIVSRGELKTKEGAQRVWLKLLDPTHADHFASGSLTERLCKAKVIPEDIKVNRVNTFGQSQAGMIQIFKMPHYLSVEQYLLDAGTAAWLEREQEREKILIGLAHFAKRCLAERILCTDFTLADTFFSGRPEAVAGYFERDPRSDEDPGLFVGDFGSYRESVAFGRGDSVTREQYRPPEDRDATLSYRPEAYMVYLLGLLFVEVISGAPGLTLDSVIQLRFGLEESAYEERLRTEIDSLLSHFPQPDRDEVVEMLAYRPESRPLLGEVRAS